MTETIIVVIMENQGNILKILKILKVHSIHLVNILRIIWKRKEPPLTEQ